MKTLILAVIILTTFSCKNERVHQHDKTHSHDNIPSETSEMPQKKVLSPHKYEMVTIGDTQIQIDYSSPGVRNRIIFGGLLSYDEVWQAGAHRATWIETNNDLLVSGKILKAGKYGFFVIPSQNEWIIIFNSKWDQHGKDEYDEKDDVVRLAVTPMISETITEHLEYKLTKNSEIEGVVSMSWDKITISFPFKVNR